MNKSYVLLLMHDALRSGRGIVLDECCTEYAISVPTFRRYMALLRDYYLESYGEEIVYNAVNKRYEICREPMA